MKKIICFILSALFVLMFASGCMQDNNESSGNVFLLSNFEQYSPDFEQMVVLNDFGAVNINKDEKFVKSGQASAKINPLGGYYSADPPVLVIPLESARFNYDFTKLTKVKNISFSLYSEQENVTIRFGYTFDDLYTQRSAPQSIQLNQGWNDLSMEVEADLLNLIYDISNCTAFYLEFDNVGYQNSKDIADAPTYYMDDIQLDLYEKEYELHDDIIVLEEDEYCSFDKLYQGYVVAAGAYTQATIPVTSVVETENGVEPTSGRKMLKVEYPAASVVNESWPGLSFTKKISQEINWNKYINEVNDWEFCFDVYSVNPVESAFLPNFVYGDGNQWNIDKQEFSVYPSQGNWVTCRISLATLYNTNNKALSDNLKIEINILSSLNERLFYFDSFRFEKIK